MLAAVSETEDMSLVRGNSVRTGGRRLSDPCLSRVQLEALYVVTQMAVCKTGFIDPSKHNQCNTVDMFCIDFLVVYRYKAVDTVKSLVRQNADLTNTLFVVHNNKGDLHRVPNTR